MDKRGLATKVNDRRMRAFGLLKPQWKDCFWTRPWGHVRDGTTGFTHYHSVCLYCGKPSYISDTDVELLEKCANEMGRYPIALGLDKTEVPA